MTIREICVFFASEARQQYGLKQDYIFLMPIKMTIQVADFREEYALGTDGSIWPYHALLGIGQIPAGIATRLRITEAKLIPV